MSAERQRRYRERKKKKLELAKRELKWLRKAADQKDLPPETKLTLLQHIENVESYLGVKKK